MPAALVTSDAATERERGDGERGVRSGSGDAYFHGGNVGDAFPERVRECFGNRDSCGPPGLTVRFGDCVFDPDARELVRDGRRVPLSPKAFQLLALLVASRPRALAQGELRDQLWPDTHVARTSLARLLTEIRRATGDDPRAPRYVRNVHGFGYAFCGRVTADSASLPGVSAADAGCALSWGEREFGLSEGENLIGRAPECRLPIESSAVSRRHARVFVARGQATIEDLGSKNGTFLGGKRVERPTRLEDGATIVVGPALLVFRGPAGQDSTKTGSR